MGRFDKFIEDGDKIILTLIKDCPYFIKETNRSKGKFIYRGDKRANIDTIYKKTPRMDRAPKDMDPDVSEYLDDKFQKFFGWCPRSTGVFCTPKEKTANTYGNRAYLIFPIGKFKYLWSKDIEDLYTSVTDEECFIWLQDIISGDDSSIEIQWSETYDEYGGSGTWYYNGEDTGESDRETVKDDLVDDGTVEDRHNIDNDLLVWNPDMSYQDYYDDIVKEMESNVDSAIKDYSDKMLWKNIDDYKSEIVISCKEYYLVNLKFKDIILKEIYGKK